MASLTKTGINRAKRGNGEDPAPHDAPRVPLDPPQQRRGRPRQADTEQRAEHLLEIATETFTRHGYADTSVDRIAAVARISKPTIYAHYGSKAELFKAVIARMTARHRLPQEDDTSDMSVEAGLEKRLASILMSATDPEYVGLFRLFLAESARFPSVFEAFYATAEAQSKALLVTHMQRYPAFVARLRQSPAWVADAMQSMAALVVLMAAIQPNTRVTIQPEAEAARIVDTVLHGVLRP